MSAQSEKIRMVCDLPKRQVEVLTLLADGETTKGIALKLHIAQKTVEYHRLSLMRRCGLYSWPELTKLAIRLGLSQVDV